MAAMTTASSKLDTDLLKRTASLLADIDRAESETSLPARVGALLESCCSSPGTAIEEVSNGQEYVTGHQPRCDCRDVPSPNNRDPYRTIPECDAIRTLRESPIQFTSAPYKMDRHGADFQCGAAGCGCEQVFDGTYAEVAEDMGWNNPWGRMNRQRAAATPPPQEWPFDDDVDMVFLDTKEKIHSR